VTTRVSGRERYEARVWLTELLATASSMRLSALESKLRPMAGTGDV